tara:strand:- start:99 stop:545 length:447 start_codon:yes stop_codon:yes gene_type:complete
VARKERFKNHTEFTGQTVTQSKRILRYIDLAKNVAYNSDYGKLRHGAILVKGGSIINTCFNKDKFCSFAGKFRDPNSGPATIHAELGCVLGLARDVTSGGDIFVCRINKIGELRNSKPCIMCHQVMKHVGIKRVYYTTNEGSVEMYKL